MYWICVLCFEIGIDFIFWSYSKRRLKAYLYFMSLSDYCFDKNQWSRDDRTIFASLSDV